MKRLARIPLPLRRVAAVIVRIGDDEQPLRHFVGYEWRPNGVRNRERPARSRNARDDEGASGIDLALASKLLNAPARNGGVTTPLADNAMELHGIDEHKRSCSSDTH